jgi:hypothetical protein
VLLQVDVYEKDNKEQHWRGNISYSEEGLQHVHDVSTQETDEDDELLSGKDRLSIRQSRTPETESWMEYQMDVSETDGHMNERHKEKIEQTFQEMRDHSRQI